VLGVLRDLRSRGEQPPQFSQHMNFTCHEFASSKRLQLLPESCTLAHCHGASFSLLCLVALLTVSSLELLAACTHPQHTDHRCHGFASSKHLHLQFPKNPRLHDCHGAFLSFLRLFALLSTSRLELLTSCTTFTPHGVLEFQPPALPEHCKKHCHAFFVFLRFCSFLALSLLEALAYATISASNAKMPPIS
jgi:hypothetical protein